MAKKLSRSLRGGADDGFSIWRNVLYLTFEIISTVVYFVLKLMADCCCPSSKSRVALELFMKKVKSRDKLSVSLLKWKRGKKNCELERGALEILTKKLWSLIGDKIENSQDWLNFIRASPDFEQLMKGNKVERLFPEVIKHIFGYLPVEDIFSLRLVNTKLKYSLDAQWSSAFQPRLQTLPVIFLTELMKVSRFTKDMTIEASITSQSTTPIPFAILVGLGSPHDPDCRDLDDDSIDPLTCEVFWKAFARCVEKIGDRITGALLDIRIGPSLGIAFSEKIINIITTKCLKGMPNLSHLVLVTNTVNVGKALSSFYSIKGADPSWFPALNKLESLEFITLGEGHPSKSKFKTRSITFPSRFLRQHGHTVKRLRVFGNLYDFKTMDVFQAPNLKIINYEIHHCLCLGKDPELKALLLLPIVEQDGLKHLKIISVKVNWQWRTNDISSFFKWLGKNYPDYQFDVISLKNSQNPLKSVDSFSQHNYRNQHSQQLDCCSHHQRKSSVYGSDFPWISKLKMPAVKTLELYSEYAGSWEFLKAVQGNLEYLLLQRQTFFRDEGEMKKVYRRGLVREIFSKEAIVGEEEKAQKGRDLDVVIWDYFPKLKEVVVVWCSINFKNVNWDLELMLSSEEYKNKSIISRRQWRITREDYHNIYRCDIRKIIGD